MKRDYAPREFAPLAMDLFARADRCQLWAKPGMGKTTMTLTHLDYLYNVWGEDAPTLVLAPLRVARDGWATEASKWKHLSGLEVVAVTGDVKARTAALKKDAQVFATNYDNLVWLKDHFDETGKAWPFRTVVADEAVKLKGFRVQQGSVRAQAIGKVAHTKVKRWINLTGTPSPNGLKDLWGQAWFLDAGQRLGRSYSAFEERWFAYKRIKDAITHKVGVVPVIMDFAQQQIEEKLRDITLTLDPADYFDLKKNIVSVIEVQLPPSARRHYKELEKELFIQLASGEDIEVFNAAALSNKCLQLANGAMYLDADRYGEGTWVEVHREKLDALQERIDETGDDPLLVVYEFKSDKARIMREWPDALDLSRADHLARAKAGEGKVWLGHPGSIGEGVDGLQEHCHRVIFFGQTWRLDLHDQVIERVGAMRQLQSGKDRAVFVDYIVTENTVDEVVMVRRDGKRSVQDHLLDYMKVKV